MDIAQALLGTAAFPLPASLVKIFSMKDDLGSQCPHGFNLGRVGSLRHGDDGSYAEEPGRPGDRLAVVPGRGGDDTAFAVFLIEAAQEVDASPYLEGADGLMVLLFNEEVDS